MSIESNIQDRKEAEFSFLYFKDNTSIHFWECFKELIQNKINSLSPPELPEEKKSKEVKGYDDFNAHLFESEEMPYGKYEGKQIWEIPASYFINITEEDRFTKRMKRYIASDVFKKRLKKEQG